jgi:hypothetical protein
MRALIATTATVVLNAGLWCRRGSIVLVDALLAALFHPCAKHPSNPASQISETRCVRLELKQLDHEVRHGKMHRVDRAVYAMRGGNEGAL